ncbi:MAG: hypothetical protein HQL28_03835 [Candidatus Omnitrophica bacterium]|nr:hypothetical protein [Candidatus Omnitrophota bacterium]
MKKVVACLTAIILMSVCGTVFAWDQKPGDGGFFTKQLNKALPSKGAKAATKSDAKKNFAAREKAKAAKTA